MKNVDEFSAPFIPLNEIESFYSLKQISNKKDSRPYIWSNSIVSIDGMQSFLEPESHGNIRLFGFFINFY